MHCAVITNVVDAIVKVWHRDRKIIGNNQRLVEFMPIGVKEVLKNKGRLMKASFVCTATNFVGFQLEQLKILNLSVFSFLSKSV